MIFQVDCYPLNTPWKTHHDLPGTHPSLPFSRSQGSQGRHTNVAVFGQMWVPQDGVPQWYLLVYKPHSPRLTVVRWIYKPTYNWFMVYKLYKLVISTINNKIQLLFLGNLAIQRGHHPAGWCPLCESMAARVKTMDFGKSFGRNLSISVHIYFPLISVEYTYLYIYTYTYIYIDT